ncbi:hypothetical protein [Pseudomonas vanderleydeniana]|uniref:Lipoprotein n=1 Tax=Pseudomonas vanderleydeniana TaxID=2745495 RepID=A0A9E6TTB3_9PSED|nr:hypothetical protein [Pseudomonas vanderleydeniana]QXI29085.1 hypothetical protein HU752_003720 [Pseudomonas vanderleydeniana]
MLLKQKPPHIRTTPLLQRPWIIPLFGVVACLCWVAIATRQPERPANGQPSKEHFILSGSMPIQTALHASARYTPGNLQDSCPYQHPTLHFDTLPLDAPRTFDFTVPIGYELPDCKLHLSEISFETEAFYGQDNQQRSITSSGAITLRDDLRKGVSGFPSSGEKHYRGLCDWQLHSTPAGLEPQKSLNCYSVDEQWQALGNDYKRKQLGGVFSRQELEGKRIRLELRKNEAS